MAKKKKVESPADINLLAASIVRKATEGTAKEVKTAPEKNPAAIALGRLGGLKGGKTRAEKLYAKKWKDIAQKAAKKIWGKEANLNS